MDEQEALRSIDAALKQESFKRDWSKSAHPYYVGRIERHGLEAVVSIEIHDLDFVDLPIIKLLSRGKAEGKRTPHLIGPDGMVCYVAQNAMVFDRYDPGGTVLHCLRLAEKVLGDGLRGRSDVDFIDEFSQYWADGPAILVDLPIDFQGDGKIFDVALSGTARETLVLAAEDGLAPSLLAMHQANRGTKPLPRTTPCRVVRINRDLSADGGALPRNLRDLAAFLDKIGAGSELDPALQAGLGLARWIAICARNATCIAEIQIPKLFDRPEFMQSRKSALPKLLLEYTEDVAIKRYLGSPIDERFLYQRNLGTVTSLAGKSIVLVGCGTIGSFLSYNLAQSGAGTLGGCLTLVDCDRLGPANLGRHLLGMAFLGQFKADGCAEYIRGQLPHVVVESRARDARAILKSLSSADLIIDATGEEAFSIALNHHAVANRPAFPPVLHVWIAGNGGAAQALLCDGPDHGCFKCQKPKLSGEPRYRVIRPGADNELRRNPACGDGLFAPFPVSASISASALALDLVLAWNSGDPRHRFRTRVLDRDRCFKVNDMNLTTAPECPACQPQ
ncbi:E2/UBC family protein [Bradyrhizobium sp. CB1717]|uniref:ThiF family adenylyltransferase n=1 Tax=Bradyrhizobium sp. CB1717 TaxID=3039154 RepID=UPI0024B04E72|nr:ThiF family adenylyltransferase [Bradyrhizobium sp. CB1717]WFU26746.1 E2/UBC family protein [Bradyrhizobium sp. CB1717]